MRGHVTVTPVVYVAVILAAVFRHSATQQSSSYAAATCHTDTDCASSRQRRSICTGSNYKMSSLIDIIEQLEGKVKDNTAEVCSRHLRKFMHKGHYLRIKLESWDLRSLLRAIKPTETAFWDQVCGQFFYKSMPDSALTKEEQDDLTQMIVHGVNDSSGKERGVVLTNQGSTVAAGHVVTGISCGGFNREPQLGVVGWLFEPSSPLDNLFFVTISGDIGQTALLYYSHNNSSSLLLGPSGHWDNLSCPKVHTLPLPASELTEAEVNGDMDGVILGTLMPMIKGRGWKLSRILRDYYENDGIRVGSWLFAATNRAETFGELVSDVELESQSTAFSEVYYRTHTYLYKGKPLKKLLPKIPEAVQQFYADYVPCTDILKKKFTIQYFLKLVKELEENKKLGVVAMTTAIVGLSKHLKMSHFGLLLNIYESTYKYTDHFAWYVLRDLVSHGFAASDRRRELGVIEAGGDTVAIGHVLAGIQAGIEPDDSSLHWATVAGNLALAAYYREQAKPSAKYTMGATGTWDRSNCPVKYRLRSNIKSAQHTTRAELLGDIDGFVLGHRVDNWLAKEPGLKLSAVLERYYGNTFYTESSQARFEQFSAYADKSTLTTETANACVQITKQKDSSFWKTDDTSFCKPAAEAAVKMFSKTVLLSTDGVKTSYKSEMLPDFKTLVAAYPGDKSQGGVISGVDLRIKLAGNRVIDRSQAAIDSLRISYMLNNMFGHRIPKSQSAKSIIKDESVYIYDVVTLTSYLTAKYGAAVSDYIGKSGILMVEASDGNAVTIGLWDGKHMRQIIDRRPSNGKAYLWMANGCSTKTDGGRCNFYNCINGASPCGTSGYVLGYGFRYCRQFDLLYNKFDNEGKLWAADVRECLMQEVDLLHRRRSNCEELKRIAFYSHVGCYKRSEHFCKMASVASNREVLFNIFEPNQLWDFWGQAAWRHMIETLQYCKKYVTQSVMNDIVVFTKLARGKMQQSISSKLQDENISSADPDDSSKCIAYANAGDCRFYQCFQQKFPCSVFGTCHMTDFEFPLCEDLHSQSVLFDYKGEKWLKKMNKCLMAKLLPLYRDTSVSCNDLQAVMFDARSDCLVDSGFCDVLSSQRNSFAVDVGTNMWSYPAVLPDKISLTLEGREYFYNELLSFRRIMGYASAECH